MDPQYITGETWSEIGSWLKFLWLFLLFSVGFGFNFLMAHAIIPSLIITGHIPSSINRFRRFFYYSAFAALGGVAFSIITFISRAGIMENVWDRFWI
tara:strand:- start:170 stop:460 length:291 start_codon:yes stop_codon:yes gene_type:complete